MRLRLSHFIWLSFVAAAASGCTDMPGEDGSNGPDRNNSDQHTFTANGPAAAPTLPDVRVASWDETLKLVQDAGSVVVVDLWSSWCIECIREFPGLVRLDQEYPEKVTCMSVNLNYTGGSDSPESQREKVTAFLQKQKADFVTIIANESDETIYRKIDLASIPAVLVFRDGELVKRFDNSTGEYGVDGFSYKEQIEPFVKQLLDDSVDDPISVW